MGPFVPLLVCGSASLRESALGSGNRSLAVLLELQGDLQRFLSFSDFFCKVQERRATHKILALTSSGSDEAVQASGEHPGLKDLRVHQA